MRVREGANPLPLHVSGRLVEGEGRGEASTFPLAIKLYLFRGGGKGGKAPPLIVPLGYVTSQAWLGFKIVREVL